MSYLSDWQHKRIEYWQPVLYFSRNDIKVDFNICAKNACSSMKGYYSWVKDPAVQTYYELDHPKVKKSIDTGVLGPDDISNWNDFAYINHPNTLRANRVRAWLNEETTTFSDFFREKSIRIAIKRDPIDRFKSGYSQIYYDTAYGPFKMHKFSVDELLSKLENNIFWNEHLETQTWWMGENTKSFDYIFDISETKKCMETINEILGLKRKDPIPEFHRMKARGSKVELTRKQISRIEKLYHIDYENGWY